MFDAGTFQRIVSDARLAPSILNTQPARWRRRGNMIETGGEVARKLASFDPNGTGFGLSCGAAVEATVLACQARGFATRVDHHWDDDDQQTWPGHRLAARIYLTDGGGADPLYELLGQRHTWRSAFNPQPPRLFGWTRQDMTLVFDAPTKFWLSKLHDDARFQHFNVAAVRRDYARWLRLDPAHPRSASDGVSRAALHMPKDKARFLRLVLGPLWPLMRLSGGARALTAEHEQTLTAPLIAALHLHSDACDITAGRALLRLCLEAAKLGLAGWPMAALTDHAAIRAQVAARLNIGPDRRLIQLIRFGQPTGTAPPKARRPVKELFDD